MTLGLYNGTERVGLTRSQQNTNTLGCFTGLYQESVGAAATGNQVTFNKSLGLVLDPYWSGIVVDLTKSTSASNAIIKY